MSSRHRKQRQQTPPVAIAVDEPGLVASPGCCINTPEGIAEMRKLTHDGVIRDAEGSGFLITGRVRWVQFHGAEAREQLEEMRHDGEHRAPGADPDLVEDGYRQYREFLDTYGDDAVLIVALVPAVPRKRTIRGPS